MYTCSSDLLNSCTSKLPGPTGQVLASFIYFFSLRLLKAAFHLGRFAWKHHFVQAVSTDTCNAGYLFKLIDGVTANPASSFHKKNLDLQGWSFVVIQSA